MTRLIAPNIDGRLARLTHVAQHAPHSRLCAVDVLHEAVLLHTSRQTHTRWQRAESSLFDKNKRRDMTCAIAAELRHCFVASQLSICPLSANLQIGGSGAATSGPATTQSRKLGTAPRRFPVRFFATYLLTLSVRGLGACDGVVLISCLSTHFTTNNTRMLAYEARGFSASAHTHPGFTVPPNHLVPSTLTAVDRGFIVPSHSR